VLEHNTQRNHVARQDAGETGVVHDESRDVLLAAGQKDNRIVSGSG
jgi:hypothetical protein